MRAYIALGSNLGDRWAHLRHAFEGLRTECVDFSDVYETDPVGGPSEQGAFLNMVVALETSLSPRELLELCQSLEHAAGRVRTEHWGPRTLDADVVVVGDVVVNEPDLVVPHPLWRERAFVVEPMRDVAREPLLSSLPSLDATGVRNVGGLFGSFDASMTPGAAAALFDGFPGVWAVAGGWAIEMFVGRPLRRHHDLEVIVARADAPALRAQLQGWELFFPSPVAMTPWVDEAYPDDENQLWCRPSADALWTLEVLFEDIRDDVYRFRKDASIALPLDEAIVQTAEGVPYVAPQLQLLYKTWRPERMRARDDVDVAAAMPLLAPAQRSWLERVLPSHGQRP